MGLAAGLGRCFVTGCAGFIGSHLVESLLEEGNTVTGYDNLSSGRRQWIEPSLGDARFTFVEEDLLDQEMLCKAMQGHDIVFHLGANADIPGGNQAPRLDFQNGTTATYNVLTAMRTTGIRQIIFSSSSTVYGDNPPRPTPETAGPLLPITQYGAGKLAAEGLISAFCDLYGMHGWMFRFGNVLGARMGHGVIYDFIAKLRRNPKELEILGDGEQEKNYFLVEDCIDGMLYGFRHAKDKSCDVFNLGTESNVKVSEIARIVTEEMGLPGVDFRYTGGQRGWAGDVPRVIYDMSKMRTLGWESRHTSADAVRIATRRLLGKEPARSGATT